MQIIQGVNIDTVLLVALGCAALCVVGTILVFGVQLLNLVVTLFFGLLDLLGGIVNGGPTAWCGCLVFLFACAACIGTILVATTCRSNPNAMNFCVLIPK